MAIKAYPLNNVDYTAEDAMLLTLPVSSGVYAEGEQFPITLTGGLSFEIGVGLAYIKYDTAKGFTVYSNEPLVFTLGAADSTLSRIDRVVVQWSQATNSVNVVVKKGTPSSTPTAPERSMTSSLYELVLFDIKVSPATTELTSSMVTSQGENEELCGYMANAITKLHLGKISAEITEEVKTYVDEQIGNALEASY